MWKKLCSTLESWLAKLLSVMCKFSFATISEKKTAKQLFFIVIYIWLIGENNDNWYLDPI